MISGNRRTARVLVPRLVDEAQTNAQCLNVKAFLARFGDHDIEWHAFHYASPDPAVAANPNVVLHKLWRRRAWQWHMAIQYLRPFDAVFYAGVEWFDAWALRLRRRLRTRLPVVGTLESLPGDTARSAYLSSLAGHPVRCFESRFGPQWAKHHDNAQDCCDLLIAVSPFLEKMGRALYRPEFITLPLGVDRDLFHSRDSHPAGRTTVVGAGTAYEVKRPDLFLKLAEDFPQADFVWYGDGPMRNDLVAAARAKGLANISYPGAVSPEKLAAALRSAALFVHPSSSEGSPKVVAEAAASGLASVVFGFYEPAIPVDGESGFVVWNDTELKDRVGQLIRSHDLRMSMGRAARQATEDLDWDAVSARWEAAIARVLDERGAAEYRAIDVGVD